jgi:hypothetical protein
MLLCTEIRKSSSMLALSAPPHSGPDTAPCWCSCKAPTPLHLAFPRQQTAPATPVTADEIPATITCRPVPSCLCRAHGGWRRLQHTSDLEAKPWRQSAGGMACTPSAEQAGPGVVARDEACPCVHNHRLAGRCATADAAGCWQAPHCCRQAITPQPPAAPPLLQQPQAGPLLHLRLMLARAAAAAAAACWMPLPPGL